MQLHIKEVPIGKDKTIVFGAPKTYNISNEIVKNLQFLGFTVIDVSFEQTFKYKNNRDRIINFLRKTFLKDKNYKNQLRFKAYRKKAEENIITTNNIDYALFIRPDLYPVDFIKFTKTKALQIFCYQWDGMKRYKNIYNYISLFDKFFVFDKNDLTEKKSPATNFYFDYKKIEYTCNSKIVYYIGDFFKDRLDILSKIISEIKKAGYTSNVNIVYNTTNKSINTKDYKSINFLDHKIDFKENLKNVENAEVIIDIVNNVHNGLSFRTFEAIGYSKKLITNNKEVKKYDFYNEHNIFIVEENNLEHISNFLSIPYIQIDENVKQKYSFSNWIKYILDIEPYQKIYLPD